MAHRQGGALDGMLDTVSPTLRTSMFGWNADMRQTLASLAAFWRQTRCYNRHSMGAPRISTFVKLGTRTDRDQSMEDMVRSVQEKLRGPKP